MRITFDNVNPQTINSVGTAYSNDSSVSIRGVGSSYDISSSLEDSNTYEGSKRSINEFRDSLKAIDVQANEDYMAVMSGCVSDEDFGKMLKDGVNPTEVEVKDMVTIIDKIKLEVAKSGKSIEGFTDTLDPETVKALTGLESLDACAKAEDVTLDTELCEEIKKAFEMVSDVSEMTDGMKKLFVSEDMPITPDNLYLAKHSSSVEASGKGSDYFSVEAKGYLVKKGEDIPYEELKTEIESLLSKTEIEVTDSNVDSGVWLVENSLPVTEKNIDKLNEVKNFSLDINDERFSKAVVIAICEGKSPKDADLTKEESIYSQAVRLTEEIENVIEKPFVKATRILEETRLKMTSEANLLLLKSNYHIDTKDMESYVEALKKIEESDEYKEVSQVIQVFEKVETIKTAPAAVIAPVAKEINTATFDEVAEKIETIRPKYEDALKTYEQVGTEVRKDLGDSIKKAFVNVPEILNELELPVTKENERAVRILGYNSMPVTKENISEIREADSKLQSVISRITPEDTLKLIRQGNSPIKMSINELNDYLDSRHDTQKEEIEKYSKFLYKLERDKEITPEERKEYIEVYRFFHQIEKTEAAAVGSVINASMDFTMANLKTAMKTTKHRGMNVTIGEVYDTLVTSSDDELEGEWVSHKFSEMRAAMKAPEETVTELVMNNVPVTAENLEAALLLRKNRGDAFKKAAKASDGKSKEKTLGFAEKISDKEDTIADYEEMADECKLSVYEECLNSDTYMDVRALQLTHMQLSVAKSYAACENYEVPVEIGGEVTSVNVKLVHNSLEEANVVISLETEELGRVSARLSKEGNEISGYISCNLKDAVSKMQEVADKLSTRVSVVWSKNSDSDLSLSRLPMRDNEETSAAELYSIAKEFLTNLKGTINEN